MPGYSSRFTPSRTSSLVPPLYLVETLSAPFATSPGIPQDGDVNARPIVRADCLKFVYTFRNQFSVQQLLALMPLLIAHLRSEHVSLGACLVGTGMRG